MSKVKYLTLLLPLLLLSGCMGGGGEEFDIQGFLKNPLIQGVIFVLVLWFVFKGSKKK